MMAKSTDLNSITGGVSGQQIRTTNAGGKPPAESLLARAVKLILKNYELVCANDGTAYVVSKSTGNPQAINLSSDAFAKIARREVYRVDPSQIVTADTAKEIASHLIALADLTGRRVDVWSRVAKTDTGIELDVGDDELTRIVVTPGTVQVISDESNSIFTRSPNCRPFVLPAAGGKLEPLLVHLNLSQIQKWLLIAWVTYTLSHPKTPTTSYVILVLFGPRGTGKSALCNVILSALIDPSVVGVQAFPKSRQDLIIAAVYAYLLMFDNMRKLTPDMSDTICMASTGAAASKRKLYTDGDEYIQQLHCAMVLNGIHPIINQPDLAQRCLTLSPLPFVSEARISEREFKRQFEADLPQIFQGILSLIADILAVLPTIEVMYPERMIDFTKWLAAMEAALKMSPGELQLAYRENLVNAVRESLQANPLAMAIIDFADKHKKQPWIGTPHSLLVLLDQLVDPSILHHARWPDNAIQLSIRLKSLQASVSAAGVDVDVGLRGKERKVQVTYTGRCA